MLFWEIIDVYAQKHTEHMSTLCGKNVKLCNLKAVDTTAKNAYKGVEVFLNSTLNAVKWSGERAPSI